MTYTSNSSHIEQREILDAFDRCPELGAFSKEEKTMLFHLTETQTYEENNQVFSSEEGGKKFYIVVYGKFIIRLKRNDYKECIAGDIFGEIAVFSEKHRLGTVHALEPSKLVVFNSEKFFNPEILPNSLILKLVMTLTKKMISYFYQEELLSSLELIRKGESENREFKTSMNREVRTPIVRTLCGFMNLHGGTIFVGVEDNGKIQGLKGTTQDYDKFERDVRSLIRQRLGTFFNNLVHFEWESIQGKNIIRIDCDGSKMPVFFRTHHQDNEQEEFIVRTGNSNTHIKKGSEIIKYYQRRYKEQV